jgi:hypothetical protein
MGDVSTGSGNLGESSRAGADFTVLGRDSLERDLGPWNELQGDRRICACGRDECRQLAAERAAGR